MGEQSHNKNDETNAASNDLGQDWLQDFNFDAAAAQMQYPYYGQAVQYPVYYVPYQPQAQVYPGYATVHDGETRALLQHVLSRLDSVERSISRIDNAVGKVKEDLRDFARDMNSILRENGVLDRDQDVEPDQQTEVVG